METSRIFRNVGTTALCWGVTGGLLMTIFPRLPFITWISEILMMLTMLLLILAALWTVPLKTSDNRFFRLFSTAFLTFLVMVVVAHFMLFLMNTSTYSLKWLEIGPVLLFLLGGAVACGAMTLLPLRLR
jgi:hypothetical protein